MRRKRMGLRAQQALYNSIGRALAAKCAPAPTAKQQEKAVPEPHVSGIFATGREAYEDDLRQTPFYQDGGNRPAWGELPEHAQWSWNRNPTARRHCPACLAGAIKIRRDGRTQHLATHGGVPVWADCAAEETVAP